MIPLQFALRRRMMMAGGGSAPISDLPLGALINVGTDGGAGTPNYEIADINNFVSSGVVLVRKNIYSKSQFGSTAHYYESTLDNLISNTIYNNMPQELRNEMMDVPFVYHSPNMETRRMFTLTLTMASGNTNDIVKGKALQLYTSNANRIKTFDGSVASWWLATAYDAERAYYVDRGGSIIYTYGWNTSTMGVAPAFAIPSETLYNATPNTDGSYNLIL